MKIVVIGGTGLMGSKTVAILRRVVTMFWQNLLPILSRKTDAIGYPMEKNPMPL